MQGGASSAKLGKGLQCTEGLPPAWGADSTERGAREAAVRLHGSQGQRWTDEHGALTYSQQPESSAMETDLTHQGLVTRTGSPSGILPVSSSHGAEYYRCCDLGIANLMK